MTKRLYFTPAMYEAAAVRAPRTANAMTEFYALIDVMPHDDAAQLTRLMAWGVVFRTFAMKCKGYVAPNHVKGDLGPSIQFGTLYVDDKPVATTRRKRAYTLEPHWTIFGMDGAHIGETDNMSITPLGTQVRRIVANHLNNKA